MSSSRSPRSPAARSRPPFAEPQPSSSRGGRNHHLKNNAEDSDSELPAASAIRASRQSSRQSGTPSPPTEDFVKTEEEYDEDEGEEEELPEWADPAFIAANAPSKRTRGGQERAALEARGSALRTRRAVGASDAPAPSMYSAGGRSGSRSMDKLPAVVPEGAIKKVLIVGAGYAGISAARTLSDLGYQVQVIEGRSRIGGRVHSVPYKSAGGKSVTVELGAAVLMGDVRGGNPLARLCSRYQQPVHKLNNSCPLHDVACGGALMEADADKKAEELFNKLLDGADEERTGKAGAVPITSKIEVGTPIQAEWEGKWLDARVMEVGKTKLLVHYNRWNKKHDEWLKFDSPRVRHVPISNQALEAVLQRQLARSDVPLEKSAQRALHWHLANLEFACAAPLTTVSAQDWDQDDANEYDGDHMILPQGYGGLLNKLAEGLDIRLRCTVKGIHHSPTGVLLDTSSGVMKADAVICTLPLGVLQLDAEEGGVLFNPPLPQPKQDALKRLGFGVLNKVALFFDKPFWSHQTDFFGRVVPNPKHRGRFFLFFNLEPASGSPVLLALAAGAAAAELEQQEDESVTKQAVDALKSMFGAKAVPDPTRTVVTRWGNDKFARGSYSYVHVGASGQDYATLGEPIGERMYFAGEHTIMEHPATVVGAYLSGLRAARTMHAKQKTKIAKLQEKMKVEAGLVMTEQERREAEYNANHLRKGASTSGYSAPRTTVRQPTPQQRGGGSSSSAVVKLDVGSGAPPRPSTATGKRKGKKAKEVVPKRGGDSSLKLRRIRSGGLGVLERAAARRAEMDEDSD